MKLKELEKRLTQEPDNLGLRVQVAGLMREAGRSVEAVELYRSVALAYRDQGRTQQAIAVCRSMLDIVPDDAACLGLLAMLQGRPATQPPPAPADRSPRRPSFDETPLPKPIPYHISDPTSHPTKLSASELDLPMGELDLPVAEGADTRPGDEDRRGTAGLAQAARRISGLISDPHDESLDLAAELDTRQRRRIDVDDLRKIDQPPPTVPIERLDDDDDMLTPHGRTEDYPTDRIDPMTPIPRGSGDDDLFTPSPRSSDDEVTAPRDVEIDLDDD